LQAKFDENAVIKAFRTQCLL